MATTGQLFEELMATFHTLGIADPPLEDHVLDVPGADRYVRVSRMIIQRLQLLAAHILRGRPDAAALIGEAESLNELQEFLRDGDLPQDQIDQQAWRLNSELSRKISVQVKPKHDLFSYGCHSGGTYCTSMQRAGGVVVLLGAYLLSSRTFSCWRIGTCYDGSWLRLWKFVLRH